MLKKFIFTLAILPFSLNAVAVDGMINVRSSHSVQKTANKLEKVLLSKGMRVFARVPHSTGAKSAGVDLRPTELIIFGNPKVGAPLMKCAQTVALDLPQKALIWQDENDAVWISFNDPGYLQKRHAINGCDEVLNKVSGALVKLTGAAAR